MFFNFLKYGFLFNGIYVILYLCTAGRSACGPGHRFGPDVRLNYLIHYILSGTGRFETDKQRFTLYQGQGFLIEPGQTTCYQADEEDPWTYIWIGFNGTLAPRILESLKLKQNGPVFSCPAALQLEELAEKLLSFFRILAQNPAQENGQRQPGEKSNYHIDKALGFIQANYSNQIHVSDVASYLGISRYHLFRLFTETTGHSPQEYIVSFCLGRANPERKFGLSPFPGTRADDPAEYSRDLPGG